MIRAVLFDWGDTLMRDFPDERGPMARWRRVEALPDAVATLTTLHERGLQLALATNAADSGSEEIRAALARVGLDALIERLYCQRELGLAKPDPAFFTRALADLGCGSQQAMMVGDDWHRDVLGARAAGLSAVWLAPPHASPRVEEGVATVHTLAELPAVIAGWR